MVTKKKLLSLLPKVNGKSILVKSSQSVGDIVREVLDAHVYFSKDYDKIADEFSGYSDRVTLNLIFDFIKDTIPYKEEKETKQATKSPGVILTTPSSDCKCYALFVAGILDALSRKGMDFDWSFAFAGYDNSRDITHVFVICNGVWVDPVLSKLDQRNPDPKVLKLKKPSMALRRLSGATAVSEYATKQETLEEQIARLAPCEAVLTVVDTRPVELVWPSPEQTLDSYNLVDAPIASKEFLPDTPTSTIPSTSFIQNNDDTNDIPKTSAEGSKKSLIMWGAVGLLAFLLLSNKGKL